MNIDAINHQTYSREDIANTYRRIGLDPPEIQILLNHLDKINDKDVLDIGCGGGRTTFFLHQRAATYLGVDYSEAMVEACRMRYPKTNFLCCDVRAMNALKSGSFDFVLFSFNGIDYISHNDRINSLREISRVLKPGGIFVFSTHNLSALNGPAKPYLSKTLNPCQAITHLRNFLLHKKNHKKTIGLEVFGEKYAIVNDGAHDFGLLTYYTTIPHQVEQLSNSGFVTLEVWDRFGANLPLEMENKTSNWIYYVAHNVSTS